MTGSGNPYSGYTYKRKWKRKRTSVFAVFTIAILLGIMFLFVNLFFGFINFSQSNNSKTTMPAINTWTVVADELTMKSNALRLSLEIKCQGGAGFLLAEELSWLVIENSYLTKQDAENNIDIEKMPNAKIREFHCESKQVFLKNKSHYQVFSAITDSFKENFELMNGYLTKLRAGAISTAEISAEALQRYNALRVSAKELDKIQENAQEALYARVLLAANKQLLSLYLLSGAGGGANPDLTEFESVLANCICNIMFTYLELTDSIIQ